MKLNTRILKIAPYILLGALFLIHAVLISKTLFIDTSGSFRTTYQGYGDIPLHMTQVAKFAGPLWNTLDEPIYAGTRLQYPFLINFISGMILRATGSWTFSFLFPSYVCVAVALLSLFFLFRKLLASSWWALLGITFFYLGGGWGIFLLHSWSDFITESFSTVTYWAGTYPMQPLTFGAPLTLSLIHTRAFLIGYALVSLALFLLQKIWHGDCKRHHILGAIFCIGILPLAHAHGFVSIGVVLATLFIVSVFDVHNRKRSVLLFGIGIASLCIALPQFIFLLSSSAGGVRSGFALFRLGWMMHEANGGVRFPIGQTGSILSFEYLRFLWRNFGLLLVLFPASLIFFIKKTKKIYAEHSFVFVLSISACALLLLSFACKFQPWDYDNNKVIVYALLCAIPSMLLFLQKLCTRWKLAGTIITFIFSLGILCSGVVDIIPKLHVAYHDLPVLFSHDAVTMSRFIEESVPPHASILTSSDHRNLVDSLAGREILVGYPGWLWTRGISYSQREDMLKHWYAEPETSIAEMRAHHIEYVLFDTFTRNNWSANETYFKEHATKLFETGEYALYKL